MAELTRGAFARPQTSLDFKTGTWRLQRPVHGRRTAPCHSSCPAGEDPQAYLAHLDDGHVQMAWESLVAANPLPAVTGRVCHHPCQSACNRGSYDESITIHSVERFLGDEALRHGWEYPVPAVAAHAEPVAVVGAGPAGLACAYHLGRAGYRATIFESLPNAGGTLRAAVPAYRCPREVLDAEIERVLALGIEFQPHIALGRDISLDELRRDFSALFLAPGTQQPRDWRADFAVPADMHTGLQLLQEWIAFDTIPTPGSAAIVGGGNTGVDLARVLRRAGVAEVHLITHERIPAPDVPAEDAMPATEREIRQAVEEGVIVHEHCGVVRLIRHGERLVGVELVRMKKLRGVDGILHRVPFEGTEHVLHVEQVIPAVGQQVDPRGVESMLEGHPYFSVNAESGAVAGHSGVFCGGDARGDHGTVSEAIGDGRRAARAIDHYLRDAAPDSAGQLEPIELAALNLNYFEHARAERPAVLPVEERTGSSEIESGLSVAQAGHEAARCLSCGSCLACDNCWTLCPDVAVLKTEERLADGSYYVFDYDYCKGCGLCASECPAGFIRMVDEPGGLSRS